MNEWQLFHSYNRLVRSGFAEALLCDCDNKLVTGMGKDGELVLCCYSCNTKVHPGENTLARVRGTVGEWIV